MARGGAGEIEVLQEECNQAEDESYMSSIMIYKM
jgi:hypothetical protein